MSGCAPTQNAMLISARENFAKVQSDPDVNKYAPLELQDAKVAMDKAEKNSSAGAETVEVEHLAYLAKQKSLLSAEVAAMKIADKRVEDAGSERNKVLLGARTREADKAQNEAEQAQNEAEMAGREAEMAVREAETQRLAAEAQRGVAEEQRGVAEEAVKEAQQSAAEAEKARLETAAAEERAKKLEAQIADLNAVQTERGLVLTLGDVLFDTAKSDLKEGAYAVVEKLAAFLQEYPARAVEIEGFTDSVGSDDYNFGLSLHRAEAVRNALSGRGIAADRILYHGYGETFPVATNDTSAGRQRNRRVEIIISDENGVISERIR
jgi:outer membrane protein OmpA-like peptidoglycan-associated protein